MGGGKNGPGKKNSTLRANGTNVGRYKYKTYKRWTVQTSDQYKLRISTNIGPVQTSDWYKTSDIYKEKRRTKKEKIYLNFQVKILVNSQFSIKKFLIFFVKIHNLIKSGYMDEETANYIEVK